jgi:hypothetical protein
MAGNTVKTVTDLPFSSVPSLEPAGLDRLLDRITLKMRPEKVDRHTARKPHCWCGRFDQGREPVPIFLASERFEFEPHYRTFYEWHCRNNPNVLFAQIPEDDGQRGSTRR